MKKVLTLILSVMLSTVAVFGSACSKEPEANYKFMVPDGAPALAIAKLIHENDNLGTGKTVEYSVLSSTQVMPNLSSGSADIIVAPVNAASMRYNTNGNDYVMVAVLTHGNFYILSTTEISVQDLIGKQVAVPNQGAVPDWTFKMVLEKNQLQYQVLTDGNRVEDKVNIKYYTQGSDIVQSIMAGNETIGLVPEPAATNLEAKYLQQKGKQLYRLDLQELYDAQQKSYPQAVLMVKKSVLQANPNLVGALQTKITESANWIKQNVASAVSAINDKGGTTLNAQTLSEKAIEASKIYWESAVDAKTSVKNYINQIIEIDSTKAIAVSDDFFYVAN